MWQCGPRVCLVYASLCCHIVEYLLEVTKKGACFHSEGGKQMFYSLVRAPQSDASAVAPDLSDDSQKGKGTDA